MMRKLLKNALGSLLLLLLYYTVMMLFKFNELPPIFSENKRKLINFDRIL